MALTTISAAEAAWVESLTAPTRDSMQQLLHPAFVGVHGPVGYIHDRDEFLADASRRPPAVAVRILDAQIREFDDIAIVTCLQEMDIPFVPDLPSFVIQAAVTRVWIRTDDDWRLVHLQMARRLPPA